MSRFRFIQAEKACYPIALLCRALQVSRAGYYAWTRRGVSTRAQADVGLTEQIRTIHQSSRGTGDRSDGDRGAQPGRAALRGEPA